MTTNNGKPQPNKMRPGLGLIITGAVIALGFAAFLLLTPGNTITSRSPLWIAVAWGVLMVLYGAYRAVRGKSRLDHPRGGTDADGR